MRKQVESVGRSLDCSLDVELRPASIVVLGYTGFSLFSALALILVSSRNDFPVSKGDVWFVLSFMVLPVAMFNWLIARFTRLHISSRGIKVTNPFNVFEIPWSEVTDIDENASGRIRFQTARWSCSSWAVAVSNWERWLNRPNRVQVLISVLATRIKSHESAELGAADAQRRWRIPRRDAIVYLVVWAACSMIFLAP